MEKQTYKPKLKLNIPESDKNVLSFTHLLIRTSDLSLTRLISFYVVQRRLRKLMAEELRSFSQIKILHSEAPEL